MTVDMSLKIQNVKQNAKLFKNFKQTETTLTVRNMKYHRPC